MKQLVVGSLILALVTLGWDTMSMGEQRPAPQGELRIVDKNPLNWGAIVYNVFEHRTLEVTLRQGVKFHNGEVFDADIVKLNWEENTRLRQPFRPGTFLNFKPGSRLEIVDPYTVRFVFPEPDGGALAKISFLHLGNRQFYNEVGWGERSW